MSMMHNCDNEESAPMSDDYSKLRSAFLERRCCYGTHRCVDRKYDKSKPDCKECAEDAYQAMIDSQKQECQLHVPGFQGDMWASWTAWQLGVTNPEGESLSEFNDYYETLKGGNDDV